MSWGAAQSFKAAPLLTLHAAHSSDVEEILTRFESLGPGGVQSVLEGDFCQVALARLDASGGPAPICARLHFTLSRSGRCAYAG